MKKIIIPILLFLAFSAIVFSITSCVLTDDSDKIFDSSVLSHIEDGMSKEEVIAILGEPDEEVSGTFRWYEKAFSELYSKYNSADTRQEKAKLHDKITNIKYKQISVCFGYGGVTNVIYNSKQNYSDEDDTLGDYFSSEQYSKTIYKSRIYKINESSVFYESEYLDGSYCKGEAFIPRVNISAGVSHISLDVSCTDYFGKTIKIIPGDYLYSDMQDITIYHNGRLLSLDKTKTYNTLLLDFSYYRSSRNSSPIQDGALNGVNAKKLLIKGDPIGIKGTELDRIVGLEEIETSESSFMISDNCLYIGSMVTYVWGDLAIIPYKCTKIDDFAISSSCRNLVVPSSISSIRKDMLSNPSSSINFLFQISYREFSLYSSSQMTGVQSKYFYSEEKKLSEGDIKYWQYDKELNGNINGVILSD